MLLLEEHDEAALPAYDVTAPIVRACDPRGGRAGRGRSVRRSSAVRADDGASRDRARGDRRLARRSARGRVEAFRSARATKASSVLCLRRRHEGEGARHSVAVLPARTAPRCAGHRPSRVRSGIAADPAEPDRRRVASGKRRLQTPEARAQRHDLHVSRRIPRHRAHPRLRRSHVVPRRAGRREARDGRHDRARGLRRSAPRDHSPGAIGETPRGRPHEACDRRCRAPLLRPFRLAGDCDVVRLRVGAAVVREAVVVLPGRPLFESARHEARGGHPSHHDHS